MANEQNLIPFTKNDPRINRKGRPPKIVSALRKHFSEKYNTKLFPQEVMNAIWGMLSKTKEELQALIDDPKVPMWTQLIANKILADYDKGEIEVLDSILNRVLGKPTERQEIEQKTLEVKQWIIEVPTANANSKNNAQ